MKSQDLIDDLKEKIIDNKLTCTEKYLEEYISYGLLIQSDDKYITRDGKLIDVNLLETKVLNFNIDLRKLIQNCCLYSKQNKEKRIFCMSERCYNEYKQKGYIVNKDNKEYYQTLYNELWLVYIINNQGGTN